MPYEIASVHFHRVLTTSNSAYIHSAPLEWIKAQDINMCLNSDEDCQLLETILQRKCLSIYLLDYILFSRFYGRHPQKTKLNKCLKLLICSKQTFFSVIWNGWDYISPWWFRTLWALLIECRKSEETTVCIWLNCLQNSPAILKIEKDVRPSFRIP